MTDTPLRDLAVYLAGPINGCSDSECQDWRNLMLTIYPNAINPMVRDYRGREDVAYVEIVDGDKQDIRNCEAVLVNYDKPSVGTSMEILYAWQHSKPVCVVCRTGTTISPWMRYHAHKIVHTFEDAIAYFDSQMWLID